MSRPNPIPFDTPRFVKRMTEAGMPPGQAEALADEQIALLNTHLATKQDIAILTARQNRFATKDELGKVKMEVAVVKARLGLVLWIVSTIGGGVLFLVSRTIWPA